MRYLYVAAVILLFTGFGCARTAQQDQGMGNAKPFTAEKTTHHEETKLYTIDVTYPQTSDDALNQQITNFVNGQVAEVKSIAQQSAQFIQEIAPYQLTINDNETSFNSLHSFILTVYTYTGGAHGNTTYQTYLFDTSTEKILTLSDLFTSDAYLSRLSDLTAKKLHAQEAADFAWFDDGLAPRLENFSNFSVDEQGITFYFPPYQVAAYAYGPQKTLIGFDELKGILNQDVFSFRS